jgi:hypothetical protein
VAGALGKRWPVLVAWEEAVRTTAAAYGIEPELLRAESRGRGPKPPERAREPKKMAVHLAVVLADCSYAELGRAIGYHKDTIAGHCAEVREAVLHDDGAETAAAALERLARGRLELASLQRIDSARAHLAMLEQAAIDLVSVQSAASTFSQPSFIRQVIRRSTDADEHEGVIARGDAA